MSQFNGATAGVVAPLKAPPSRLPVPEAPKSAPARPAYYRWAVPGAIAVALIVVGVLLFVFRASLLGLFQPAPPPEQPKPPEVVRVEGPGLVHITPATPLEKRLSVVPVGSERVTVPVLNVTGSIAARLPPGSGDQESRWDFAAPEVAASYGDWLKAQADVRFAREQTKRVRELADARTGALKADVARLTKLVDIGTETARDLAKLRADLLQSEIQGNKDVHEAENAVKVAERSRDLIARQLLSNGVDPEAVSRGEPGLVLVVADVPESKVGLVREGQACEARFFSYPNQPFRGRVARLGPSVSKERRTLRVTFELDDAGGKLLPGMFADVGLGTESRDVLAVPSEAVLHIGRADYVLVVAGQDLFRVAEVQVGEPLPGGLAVRPGDAHGIELLGGAALALQKPAADSRVAILSGLKPGDRVLAAGAILLKPVAAKAVGNGNGNGNGH